MAFLESQAQTLLNALGDDDNIDYGKLARVELMRLQRQYRLMEGDQRNFKEESGTTISRQYRMLNHLRNEKEDLETDLANAECKENKISDSKNQKFIRGLIQRYEKYEQDISSCITEIKEIEEQVDTITQKVVTQNLKIMGLFGQSMTPSVAEKRLSILENRLYQKTTKYDTLVCQNNKLRADINNILAERGAYHKRSVFVKKCTAKMKGKMMEVVEITTAIYDARDEYANKIKALREKDEKDTRLHVHEMAEILRVQHDSLKFREFMMAKMKSRAELEVEEQRQVRHQLTKERELNFLLSKYKKAFRVILELGFTPDIETLCTHYFEEEQSNFAKFQYMNDLHNEIEVLQQSVQQMKEEIEKSREMIVDEREKNTATLEALEDDTDKYSVDINHLNENIVQLQHDINIYMQDFEASFQVTGCEEAYKNLLGNQGGMKPENMCLCFQILENKIDELIIQNSAYGLRKSVELEGGSLAPKAITLLNQRRQSTAGGPFKAKLIISGRLDATDEDADDDKWMSLRPLSRKEIMTIIMDKIVANDEVFSTSTLYSQSQISLPETLSQISIYRKSSMIAAPIKRLDVSKVNADTMESQQQNKAEDKDKVDQLFPAGQSKQIKKEKKGSTARASLPLTGSSNGEIDIKSGSDLTKSDKSKDDI